MYPKTQQLISDFLFEKVMYGVSYAFIQRNNVEKQTKGLAQIIPDAEILREEMLFDVASLTKVICTTTLVLKLVEGQKLSVDDSLQKHLPTFNDSQVTIRHLLTHTSAINPYIENRDSLSAEELRFAMLSLNSTENRGRTVAYTDTGTVLLGFMLEEIYQQDLHSLFEKEILQPLGMKNSLFKPRKTSSCVPTENHTERGLIRGEVHDPKAFTLQEHCGSAGLFTNLEDCLIFVQMILNYGKAVSGAPFLQKETIENLLRDQTPTGKLKRSLGWDLKFHPCNQQPMLFHTGYTGTFLLIDVSHQAAFIFLSNRVHPIDNREAYIQKRDELLEIYLEEHAFS